MQPLKQLTHVLRTLADREHCIFTASDLAAVLPDCNQPAVVMSRAVKAGLLRRICKGVFLYPVPDYPAEHLLFHAAARLRASEFNELVRPRENTLRFGEVRTAMTEEPEQFVEELFRRYVRMESSEPKAVASLG